MQVYAAPPVQGGHPFQTGNTCEAESKAMALKSLETGMALEGVGSSAMFRQLPSPASRSPTAMCQASSMMDLYVRWPTCEQEVDLEASFRQLHWIPGVVHNSYTPIYIYIHVNVPAPIQASTTAASASLHCSSKTFVLVRTRT